MQEILISEILFTVIILIAAIVLREFIVSKDGVLRKIMIWYFIVEIFVYATSAIYFYLGHLHVYVISASVFRMIVLLPKVAIKLRLLFFLKTKK